MKKIIHIQSNNQRHWVGNGFPVRTIFTYNDLAKHISPFLLMDYAGPANFTPTTEKRGVEEHPHRGFETVTLVYAGEVEHRDSAGGGGIIQAGDVQWMTAASGLVHEEFHGPNFTKTGGAFEMVQLWVNLPQKLKMTAPRYQGISSEKIPTSPLQNNSGLIRVIAGNYENLIGPAKTHSPINMWDLKIKAHHQVNFEVPKNHTATLFVLSGQIKNTDGQVIKSAELAVFETENNMISFQAEKDTVALFLGGEPLNEPIVGYGPFVMNTKLEIQQAFTDFQDGKMGTLSLIDGSE